MPDDRFEWHFSADQIADRVGTAIDAYELLAVPDGLEQLAFQACVNMAGAATDKALQRAAQLLPGILPPR